METWYDERYRTAHFVCDISQLYHTSSISAIYRIHNFAKQCIIYMNDKSHRGGIPLHTKEAVARRIIQLCEEKNIAVNALATRSGVTPSTVYSMLN